MQHIMSAACGWKHFNLAGERVYIGRNVFFTVSDLGRVTGKAEWQQLLEDNQHSALPGKLSSAFPFLSLVYSKATAKYERLRGNLKEAYELLSPEKEQVAVLK